LREAVFALVQARFPTLSRLTKGVVRIVEQTSTLQRLLVRISAASTPEEVRQLLLDGSEEDDDE
jgi:hypothetical protein